MSVGLHRDEPRLFEHGAEHDRGARAHLHLRGRPAQVPQDALQALEIGCRDLQDVAVLARNVMTLEHARVLLQVAHPWFIADVVGVRVAHGDEGRDRETGPPAIHPRVVPGDVTRLLEPLHALHHRGPRQADLVSDCLVARAPIGAEDAQEGWIRPTWRSCYDGSWGGVAWSRPSGAARRTPKPNGRRHAPWRSGSMSR